MFNNCDPNSNGERLLFNTIKDKIQVIFDVGCRSDSEFTDFTGTVHYFEPVSHFIDALSKQPTKNSKSYYNNFGLGHENAEMYYYPRYQSFYDRVASCNISDDANKVMLTIKRAADYINDNGIETVDFVKIDTKGYELNVLHGFGEHLRKVGIVQFEYGGTFLDNKKRLIDVVEYLREYGFEKFSYLTGAGPPNHRFLRSLPIL